MTIKTYSPDFWRWYFQEYFTDFEHLHEGQNIVSNAINPFNVDDPTYDMVINFEEETCTDSEQIKFRILEYIALLERKSMEEAAIKIDIEYERWMAENRGVKDGGLFYRDIENLRWKKNQDDDEVVVTEFDITLHSVIEKFNRDQQEWERTYQGNLRFYKSGGLVIKPFSFEPFQTHSKKEFSQAVWEKDFLEVKFKRDEEVRRFWAYLDQYYDPRIVREYDHYGFIDYEGKPYFLAENVLVKLPQNGENLQLIAKVEGAFNVGKNKFVRPPEDAVYLPCFDIGFSDPETHLFEQSMGLLLDEPSFKEGINVVEDHLCAMIGGESEFRHWGKLILGYVFSYLFFDEIYEHFKHGIFLYLYGEGNVGKGELAKRILDFFGINYLDSLNTPPARSVDEALEQKSKIPLWIDEHVPEVPGKNGKIDDQVWNSWFELKPRPTNIQKRNNKWGKERKEVRTFPLFCSNYKPRTDHLLSRCLVLEYRKSVRGPEKHVRWLKQNKSLLQMLMLSFMQHYHQINRKVFIWNLDQLRTIIQDEVKQELNQRFGEAVLQDRQISQYATLLTIYHWLFGEYREKMEEIYREKQNLEVNEDSAMEKIQLGLVKSKILGLTDSSLYKFVTTQIMESAVTAARYNPLSEYIETIGTLIQEGEITRRHFNWTREGTLKIWAKAVWDKYEFEKRGTDGMVRKEEVENKLKEISELDQNGQLKTLSLQDPISGERTRQRGFYIPNAVKFELLRHAFNWDKYCPTGSRSYIDMDDIPDDEELPF